MNVQHDPENSRFFIPTPDGDVHLDYEERPDNVLVFRYVYAPHASRGKGHAAKVLIAAFDWAEARDATVIPTCPYIAHTFLPRFPEYRNLVER